MILFLAISCNSGTVELIDSAPSITATSESTYTVDTAVTGTTETTTTATATTTATTTTTTTTTGPAPVNDVAIEVHSDISSILVVTWSQQADATDAWLEFSFEDDFWEQSPPQSGEIGEHREVVLGLPTDTEVQVRIVNTMDGDTVTSGIYTGTTGPLPGALHSADVYIFDDALASPERYMLTTISVGTASYGYGGPCWVVITDRQGRYVWFWEVPDSRLSLFSQVSSDGTHIKFDGTTHYVWASGVEPGIWSTTLDLEHFEYIELDQFGFTFDEIDGGLILYDDDQGDDSLIERDADGNERVVFNCDDYMDSIGQWSASCSPNGIVWRPDTDTILWSMYNVDTVFEIDRVSGEMLRQFGQLSGGYTFVPPTSVVDYQHYANYTPEGNFFTSTHTLGENTQRASEWEVDDATQTLTEVWRYDDSPYYAAYGGEAYRLSNNNTLISYGTDGATREVTYDKEVVWDIEWETGPLMGHNTLIDDLYALNRGPLAQ